MNYAKFLRAPSFEEHLLLTSTVYCVICNQKTFLNWLWQCLSFLNIFFGRFLNWLCQYLSFLNRFCPVGKSGISPHYLYGDSLTLTECKSRWCSKKYGKISQNVLKTTTIPPVKASFLVHRQRNVSIFWYFIYPWGFDSHVQRRIQISAKNIRWRLYIN